MNISSLNRIIELSITAPPDVCRIYVESDPNIRTVKIIVMVNGESWITEVPMDAPDAFEEKMANCLEDIKREIADQSKPKASQPEGEEPLPPMRMSAREQDAAANAYHAQ